MDYETNSRDRNVTAEMKVGSIVQEGDVDILDLLVPIVNNKYLIAKITICSFLLAFIFAYLKPNQYTAEAKILPPQQPQSSLNTMMGQIGQLGVLSGITGKDIGIKNPSDLYVGILNSRSVSDDIIDKFNLKQYYRDSSYMDARQDLRKDVQFESGKDGMIVIRVENESPMKAAEIANAFVDQLYLANKRLALSEASQRRLFFEQQLEEEKTVLDEVESKFEKVQESTGLIQLNSQTEAIIRTVATLKAAIASKEVELQSIRLFATEQNPEVIRLQQTITTLQSQLRKTELNDKPESGNIVLPTGKIPAASLKYFRNYRDVKYHEGLFELLSKQYEAARIDEGRSAAVVQIVDRAIEPDQKSGPKRSLICLLGILVGLLMSCFYIWAKVAFNNFLEDESIRIKLSVIRKSLFPKSE